MANLGVHYKAVCSLSTCKVTDELCAGQEQQTPVCSTPLCKKGKQRSVFLPTTKPLPTAGCSVQHQQSSMCDCASTM